MTEHLGNAADSFGPVTPCPLVVQLIIRRPGERGPEILLVQRDDKLWLPTETVGCGEGREGALNRAIEKIGGQSVRRPHFLGIIDNLAQGSVHFACVYDMYLSGFMQGVWAPLIELPPTVYLADLPVIDEAVRSVYASRGWFNNTYSGSGDVYPPDEAEEWRRSIAGTVPPL